MNKFFAILLIIILAVSCANKQNTTTSKIKLFGAGAFSLESNIGTKANNGLILYGKSSDGKSFMRKIDSNAVEFNFPNGLWNFYVVSWEQAGALSAFQGKTYCGKAENINLAGPDVVVNLTMSNAGCADLAFTPISSTEAGVQVLPKYEPVSCRDVTRPTAYSDDVACDRDTKNNRGYATYFKYVVYNYDKFGNGLANASEAFASACFKLDTNSNINAPASVQPTTVMPNGLSFPDTINGFKVFMRVYYSPTDEVACNDAIIEDRDELILDNSPTPRTRTFVSGGGPSLAYKKKVFFESNEIEVCRGSRLSAENTFPFAGGAGTNYSPYIICTPEQFNKIGGSNFPGYKTNSFEIASDLDFGLIGIIPIGDSMSTSATNYYIGSLFEGNDHILSNVFIKTTTQNDVGVFRKVASSKIKNLTVKKIGIVADGKDNVGGLIGSGQALTLERIKVSGHIEGNNYVGGILGLSSAGLLSINKSHTVLDLKGMANAGGLVGQVTNDNSSSSIVKSSVTGTIRASNCNAGASQGVKLGGFVGYLNLTADFNVAESIAKADIDGCTNVGGMFGYVNSSSTSLSILNSYVKSGINGRDESSAPIMGGVAGTIYLPSGTFTFTNSFILAKKVYSQKYSIPSSSASVAGSITASTQNCPAASYVVLDDSANTTGGTCNNVTNIKNYEDMTSFFTTTNFPSSIWELQSGGAPHLKMEKDDLKTSYLTVGECDNGYASVKGSGTALDPYIICKASQFQNITASNFYKLGDDIFLSGNLNTFGSGVYRLNGQNHKVFGAQYGIEPTPAEGQGIFKSLSVGSKISDITFYGAKAIGGNVAIPINLTFGVGVLAGKNAGTIENVKLVNSSLTATSISGSSTGTLIFGGMVGINSGEIRNIHMNTNITMGDSAGTNNIKNSGTATLFFGGVAGTNSSAIEKVETSGMMNLYYNSSAVSSNLVGYITAKNYTLAGLTPPVIQEIKAHGGMTLGSSIYQTNVKASLLTVFNDGSINDILFASYMSVSPSNFPSIKVIDNNTNGTGTRMFIVPEQLSGLASLDLSNLTKSFCLTSASFPGCFIRSSTSLTLGSTFNLSGNFYDGANTTVVNSPAMTDWNIGLAYYPNSNSPYVWGISGSNPPSGYVPDLIRVEGGFEEFENVF